MPLVEKLTSDLVGALLKPVGDIIDTLDTRDEKIAALQSRWMGAFNGVVKLFEAQRDVIVAEARAESWLTQSWRPITMLSFVAIVVNNWLIAPYAQVIFGTSIVLDIPADLWNVIQIGVGGYVASRGLEKVAESVASSFGKTK